MEDNKYLENIDFTENFLDEDKIKTDSNVVKAGTVGLKWDIDFDDVTPPVKVAVKIPLISTTGKVNNPYKTKIMIFNSRPYHYNKRYRSNKTVPPIMRKVPYIIFSFFMVLFTIIFFV